MFDAIIISDVHLGSENCQARQLTHFLESIHSETVLTRRLILNGDVFDSIDFRRLKKNHWKVLSILPSFPIVLRLSGSTATTMDLRMSSLICWASRWSTR